MLYFADACILKIFIYMMICCMHVFIHKLLIVVIMSMRISLCILYICCTRKELGEFILIKIKLNSLKCKTTCFTYCEYLCLHLWGFTILYKYYIPCAGDSRKHHPEECDYQPRRSRGSLSNFEG